MLLTKLCDINRSGPVF